MRGELLIFNENRCECLPQCILALDDLLDDQKDNIIDI